jgi:hypothetical protein
MSSLDVSRVGNLGACLLEADFWPAWVNFRIAHYSSNRRIPSGVRYSDYITMGSFRFASA